LSQTHIYSTIEQCLISTTCARSEMATNSTDSAQTVTITLSETKTTTKIFEHTHGLTITGSAEGEYGVPMVANGKVKIEVSLSNEFKWGKHTNDTKTFTLAVPVVDKPWAEVTAMTTATKSDLEVSFTMTWKSVKTGYELKTKGVYKDTTYWDVKASIKQADTGENREIDEEDPSQGWEEVDEEVHVETTASPATDEERTLDNEAFQGGDDEFEERA
jgi:hypothetical protein